MATSPLPPPRRDHAPVNGIRLYHEVHGPAPGTDADSGAEQVPLVLLHGGGSTIDVTFGRVLPLLARSRQVIALEEQAHGRSSDRDGPLTFEGSADDVIALLDHLGVATADVFGFSNGASVGLQAAIRHPQRVRRLVFASAMTRRDGAWPELWQFMRHADIDNMPRPLKDAFLRVNPDPARLKVMHDKGAARMRAFADVPDDALRSVRAATLVVVGDRDIVKPEHALELTRLIRGARLLVVPGGHGDYLGEAVATRTATPQPELTARQVAWFLDEARSTT